MGQGRQGVVMGKQQTRITANPTQHRITKRTQARKHGLFYRIRSVNGQDENGFKALIAAAHFVSQARQAGARVVLEPDVRPRVLRHSFKAFVFTEKSRP
jgi:hypothetical protein